MPEELRLSRRALVHAPGVLSGLAVLPIGTAIADADLNHWALGKATPGTDSGPFYPLLNKPLQAGTDLASRYGKTRRAEGQLLYVVGQVLDMQSKPIKGVEIQIWQANSAGRYTHPSDGNPAPLDPNFNGFGLTTTDAEGRYLFRTIVPGSYPILPNWSRAPHIHFQVTGRRDRAITQMWFPDQALNDQDRLFTRFPLVARAMMTCKLLAPSGSMEPKSKVAGFNLVIPNG